MNIYDFDNTIFKGDSSVKFFKYSLIRHPFIVLYSILKAIKECIKYLFHKSNFGNIKSELFSYVKYIKNLDEYMDKYTMKYIKNIKKFYLENSKNDDLVISASFLFIVKPFCDKIGIKNVIATSYDIKNGKIIGNNCKGEEKVKRFNELYKGSRVLNAYSDSLSDVPMLKLAKNAYIVKGEELIKFNK